jgi:polyisoprenoid-binding protein YceI
MSNRRVLVAALVLAASPALAGDTYVVDKGHSEATFQVRHLVTKVRGHFGDFEGTIQVDPARPEASTVEFVVKAASLDTAHAERDKHLRSADFFDVEEHPEIRFKSSKITAKGKDAYEVSGTLTMRGISKEITLPVSFLGFAKDPWGNEKAGFETQITLNRKDFGMVWNKTLDSGGWLLGDEAYITVNIEANKKKDTASR